MTLLNLEIDRQGHDSRRHAARQPGSTRTSQGVQRLPEGGMRVGEREPEPHSNVDEQLRQTAHHARSKPS